MRGRQDGAKQKKDNREPLLVLHILSLKSLHTVGTPGLFFHKNYVLLPENVLYMFFFSSVCIETLQTSTGKNVHYAIFHTKHQKLAGLNCWHPKLNIWLHTLWKE